MTKQVAVIAAAIMTTLLGLVALWQFRIVVVYLLLSLVIAATFRPISRSESRVNMRTRILQGLRFALAAIVAGILLFLVGRFLVHDFQQLTQNLSEQSAWALPSWLQNGPFQQSLGKWLPTPDNLFTVIIGQPGAAFSAIMGFTEGIGGVISGLVISFFLSVYWSINQNHFERLWLSLLPAEKRKRARYIWQNVEKELGAYSRSEIIQSVLAVILLGLGYWLIGSPYPTLLAVTGAIAWLIPVVGGVLALILPLVLGLLASPQLALLSVLYTVVILAILQVAVEPRLFRLQQDNPLLTFLVIMAMADAFGLLGIIVAPPISVIVQVIWRLLVSDRIAADTEPVVQVSDLKERQVQLQAAIENIPGTPPPVVISSMERLTGLLEKAEPLLQTEYPQEPHTRPRPHNLPS
ncbi:MAG: AI-2E family transporter [Bacteroidota bacterium]